ncbi:MAG: ECF-type sigma factor [Planctomycetota bacterium JB042]
MDAAPELEALLERARAGDAAAAEGLIAATHGELHRLARMIMRDNRPNHTLQATALVNEAFLRIAAYGPGDVDDVRQFIRRATKLMRTALIDHERARKADKRGAGKCQLSMSVSEFCIGQEAGGKNVLDVDAALKRLEEVDPELAQVVELKTFGGLAMDEIAEALDVPKRTVERRWRTARMWLLKDLTAAG